jgi:hypothetical protein
VRKAQMKVPVDGEVGLPLLGHDVGRRVSKVVAWVREGPLA